MKLSSSNGTAATLDFEDYYAGFSSEMYPFNKNRYNTIKNPQILEPGTYKMQIEEVYKGSKYDDTVLGEVWFMEFSDDFSKFLDEIQKIESPIIFDSFKKIIQSKTVDFKSAEWWHKEHGNNKD